MAKFKSNTHVCLNVVTPNGANVHVSFTEQTGKGSVYYTKDPNMIAALRNHHRFGKLFVEEAEPVQKVQEPVKETAASDQEETPKKNVKEFSNNEDAKDYFAERFDVSRSKLRTRAAIEEVAKGLGVTVIWKE